MTLVSSHWAIDDESETRGFVIVNGRSNLLSWRLHRRNRETLQQLTL